MRCSLEERKDRPVNHNLKVLERLHIDCIVEEQQGHHMDYSLEDPEGCRMDCSWEGPEGHRIDCSWKEERFLHTVENLAVHQADY